eukprot:GHRQ01027439.1.p1 GENE.GHRQ01027439.1~~GHRQ01027439.1.p1  ORF type:complete len:123 (+),score=24.89 GHRQ01027439.1:160-528(+)
MPALSATPCSIALFKMAFTDQSCCLPALCPTSLRCPASSCRDLSLWAFEKLADPKYGVIALSWRDVPCWHKPNKRAKNKYGQRSSAERGVPRGWKPAFDKRPFKKVMWANKQGRKLRGALSA